MARVGEGGHSARTHWLGLLVLCLSPLLSHGPHQWDAVKV